MPDSFDLLEEDGVLDLGLVTEEVDEIIDFNGQYSLLNHFTYNVSVAHDLDGQYDDVIETPEMADERARSILWVLMTSGFFHRIRVEAVEAGQGYHVNFLEATMSYQGQFS